jgi:enamine deaminase RidA (YjgF/YER057c/UK114 family)
VTIERRHLTTDRTPANMSQGVKAGNIVAVSGQVPLGPDGQLVGAGDIGAQAEQCFANIAAVLGQVGAGLDDIVKLTAFLLNPADLPRYLEVRGATFTKEPPASTTVVAAGILVPGGLIEIEALAVVDE